MFVYVRQPQLQPLDGIFYKTFLNLLAPVAGGFPSVYSIITFILLFVQAISFNKIVNSQRLHRQTNYLTGMSYLLVTSLFSEWFSLSAPLLVNTFLIWIWARLCGLYNNPNAKASIFNIGMATGLVAFIYFPSITFLLLIISGIAIGRPFRLQEWLLGLLGILTPVYFYASYLFLTDKINSFHFPGLHFSYPHFFGNKWAYAALGLIAIGIAAGIYFVNRNMRRQVVQTRKSWQLIFYLHDGCGNGSFFKCRLKFFVLDNVCRTYCSGNSSRIFLSPKKDFPRYCYIGLCLLFM